MGKSRMIVINIFKLLYYKSMIPYLMLKDEILFWKAPIERYHPITYEEQDSLYEMGYERDKYGYPQ